MNKSLKGIPLRDRNIKILLKKFSLGYIICEYPNRYLSLSEKYELVKLSKPFGKSKMMYNSLAKYFLETYRDKLLCIDFGSGFKEYSWKGEINE